MNRYLMGVATIVTLTALSAPAVAADLPRKSVVPMFVTAPTQNWTGLYVGINGGWGQSTFTDKDAGNTSDSVRANGGLIGLTFGYNHQFANNVVLGVEGDYSFSFIEKKENFSTPIAGFGRFEETSNSRTTSFGTARVRLGYAFGAFMPYLTGGLAMATNKFELTDQFIPLVGAASPLSTANASKTKTGWTLGIGAEYMVTQNWTVKAEYLYADLGTADYTFTASNGFGGTGKIGQEMHIARAGINYKF
jgi:outer membrane immunogenic protein